MSKKALNISPAVMKSKCKWQPVLQNSHFFSKHILHVTTANLENCSKSLFYIKSFIYMDTKIMGKTASWITSCFYPLTPLNNVKKQWAKLVSSYVMGSQHCIGGEGDF